MSKGVETLEIFRKDHFNIQVFARLPDYFQKKTMLVVFISKHGSLNKKI